MKKLLLILIAGMLLLSTGYIIAQETSTVDVSEEISLDEEVTAEDLEIKDPNLLPDSPFYFFKNWGRSIKYFFTFNSVKKAELKLKYADERIIEIKKLIKEKGDPKKIKEAFEKYQEELEGIASNDIDDSASKFFDKFTKHQTLHYRILQKLEDQVPEEVYERIRTTREEHLRKFGEVMNKLENKEQIREKLEKNLEELKGSEFKGFKNLEILKEIEEKAPEQAKEAIRKARENTLRKLKIKAEDWTEEQQEKFKEYLEEILGNEEIQLEILEDLKSEIDENAPIKAKLGEVRTRIIEKIPFETAECPEIDKEEILKSCPDGRIIFKRDEGKCIINYACIEVTETKEEACITIWDPVCGKDGKNYSNSCFAKQAGIEIDHEGHCEAALTPVKPIPINSVQPKKAGPIPSTEVE